MKRSAFSIFLFLIVSYILCYAFALFYTATLQTINEILPEFRFLWLLSNSFLLFFVWLPPIHYSVLLFLYSFIFSRTEIFKSSVPRQEILSRISQAIILFLVITALYVILYETAYPRSYETVNRTETISSLITMLNEQKEGEDDLEQVKKILLLQRSIFPENEEIEDHLRIIMNQIEEQTRFESPVEIEQQENQTASHIKNSSWYTSRARSAYQKKDWSSAVYYSQLALTLDAANLSAQDLYQTAKQHIYGTYQTPEEGPSYFDRKKNALAVLEAGNNILAYYQYLELSKEQPLDKEVKENLLRAKRGLLTQAFFISEVSNLDAFSTVDSGLIFLLQTDSNEKILFYWDKIIPIGPYQYIQNIEGIAFSSEGEFLYQMKAPYGKVIGNRLLLQGLDEENPAIQFLPEIIRGDQPIYPLNQIQLPDLFTSLPKKGFAIQDLQNLTLGQLFQMKPVLSSLGYIQEIVESEILERLIKIFSFLSLSFLSMALGWYSRFRFERFPPSYGYSLFLPLFVYFTYYLYEIYILSNKLFASFMLLHTGLVITRLSLILIQFIIILIMVLMYVNLYKIRKR